MLDEKVKLYFCLKLIILISLFLFSCIGQNKIVIKNKTKDISTSNRKYIISAPIIFKNFIKKNAEATNIKEIFLQRSTQDYYIKFCESNISRKKLETLLSNMDCKIKTVTLEIEFRDGYFDICNGDNIRQSRIGKYIIIHRIIKDKKK